VQLDYNKMSWCLQTEEEDEEVEEDEATIAAAEAAAARRAALRELMRPGTLLNVAVGTRVNCVSRTTLVTAWRGILVTCPGVLGPISAGPPPLTVFSTFISRQRYLF
jgi:hypothetical protein